MPSLSTLIDNFNDNVISGNWGNSYGGVTEVGGRARIPCVAGNYAGYQTGRAWTFAGSTVYLQIPVVPAVAGATTGAHVVFSITVATAGTSIAFNINTVAGTMRCESNVDYFDSAATVLTYSPTDHLWLRLREDGTNVYWDTSPNGTTWTNRRTLATPAWIPAAVDACALDLWCYRNSGTTNHAEIDNVNTMADGAVWTATAALTADGALTGAASKTTVIGAALTAETALDAGSMQTVLADANLSVTGELGAQAQGDEIVDADVYVGAVTGGWEVHGPWV